MAKYAEWDGYRQMYPDGLGEEEFLKVIGRAEALIDIWTAGRAEGAQEQAMEQVKMAAYALANILARQGVETAGAQIVSVSNDGYSEQYRALSEDGLRAEAMRWLSGTGLVSAL